MHALSFFRSKNRRRIGPNRVVCAVPLQNNCAHVFHGLALALFTRVLTVYLRCMLNCMRIYSQRFDTVHTVIGFECTAVIVCWTFDDRDSCFDVPFGLKYWS